MNFDLGYFNFSFLVFVLSVETTLGEGKSAENTQKNFFLVFLLSVEALLEADPNEFLIWDI
jgi:hypothetical protein